MTKRGNNGKSNEKKPSKKMTKVETSSSDSEYIPYDSDEMNTDDDDQESVYETETEDEDEDDEEESYDSIVEKFKRGYVKKPKSNRRETEREKEIRNHKPPKTEEKKQHKKRQSNSKQTTPINSVQNNTKKGSRYIVEESEEEEEEEEDSEQEDEEEDSEDEDHDELEQGFKFRIPAGAKSDGQPNNILVMNIMDGAVSDEYMEDEFGEEYETDENEEINTDDENTFMRDDLCRDDLCNLDPKIQTVSTSTNTEPKRGNGNNNSNNKTCKHSKPSHIPTSSDDDSVHKPTAKSKASKHRGDKSGGDRNTKDEEKRNGKHEKKDKNQSKASKDPESDNSTTPNNSKTMSKYNTLNNMRNFIADSLVKDPDNKILKNALQDVKENIRKLIKKARSDNARQFHEIVSGTKMTGGKMGDLEYFKKKLSNTEQIRAMTDLKEINQHIYLDKPYRMAILQMNISFKHKAAALTRLDTLKQMEMSGESGGYVKMKEWLDVFMRIPFGIYRNLPVKIGDGHAKCYNFMHNAKKTLDECTYGLNDAKMQIMQVLGNWISNPSSIGTAIAIRGPPGTGKCMVVDTPILMYDGTIRKVQDVAVGDLLMGDDSTPRTVLSLASGEDDLYDIVQEHGETYGVNSEHILCLKIGGHRMLKISIHNLPVHYSVEYFSVKNLKSNTSYFETESDAKAFLLTKAAENTSLQISVKDYLHNSLDDFHQYIRGFSVAVDFTQAVNLHPLIMKRTMLMYDYGHDILACAQFDTIPDEYRIAEHMGLCNLLAGFIDGCGYKKTEYDVICCENIDTYNVPLKSGEGLKSSYGGFSPALVTDILFIARSIGLIAYVNEKLSEIVFASGGGMNLYVLHSLPVRKCPRVSYPSDTARKDPCTYKYYSYTNELLEIQTRWDGNTYPLRIKPRARGKYYGFELDGNRRYILGGCTVTHNTTIARDGISKILGREFAFITLGGATDGAFLDGFSYTYEGAKWGKIVQILLDSKSMNPVIYFDELDKISQSEKGQELVGVLTHLTDTSQNNQFHDKYFSEIDFDLSRCLFVFSFNDENLVNPILKDRMYVIETKGYTVKEKVIIARKYMFPKILEEVYFKQDEIIMPDEIIQYLLERADLVPKEDGVRNLKRALEIIVKKINLLRLMTPAPSIATTSIATTSIATTSIAPTIGAPVNTPTVNVQISGSHTAEVATTSTATVAMAIPKTGKQAKPASIELFGEEYDFEVKFPMTITKHHVDMLLKKRDIAMTAWQTMFV